MRPIFSLIFDLLTDPLGLPVHPLWEYVILLVIGEIAFRIAWNASPGGFGGSTIHWFVRIVAFLIMWAIVYSVITAARFVILHWIPILFTAIALAIIGIIFTIICKREARALNL